MKEKKKHINLYKKIELLSYTHIIIKNIMQRPTHYHAIAEYCIQAQQFKAHLMNSVEEFDNEEIEIFPFHEKRWNTNGEYIMQRVWKFRDRLETSYAPANNEVEQDIRLYGAKFIMNEWSYPGKFND